MLLGSDSEVVAVDMLMMIVLTVIPDDLDFRWIAMDGTDTGFFAVTDEMKIMYHYLNNQIPDEPKMVKKVQKKSLLQSMFGY